MRASLRRLLELEPDFGVLVQADELGSLLDELAIRRPDVVALDSALIAGRPLRMLEMLRRRFPDGPVVLLSMHALPVAAQRAMEARAVGFVVKPFADEELAPALRAAVAGHRYLSPHATPAPTSRAGSVTLTSPTLSP
jgi:DNA-binding NarL/FixJ family response regulator